MGGVSKVGVAMVVMLMIAVNIDRPAVVEGVSCARVTSSLILCLKYLTTGSQPGAGCCYGVKRLNTLAKTPDDRKETCACIKKLADTFSGINSTYGPTLPEKCGVMLPYAIGPDTNCTSVT